MSLNFSSPLFLFGLLGISYSDPDPPFDPEATKTNSVFSGLPACTITKTFYPKISTQPTVIAFSPLPDYRPVQHGSCQPIIFIQDNRRLFSQLLRLQSFLYWMIHTAWESGLKIKRCSTQRIGIHFRGAQQSPLIIASSA